MTQTADLIHKMADFFTSEEFLEKGEDARLELSPDDVRCMNKVIKACGNAISRQAVLDLIEHYNSDGLGSVFYGYEEGVKFADAVNKLPSVSTEKTGRWICGDDVYENGCCSVCNYDSGERFEYAREHYKYCPNCGAKMREVGESE